MNNHAMAMQDGGLLDGAHKILLEFRERKSLGVVGRRLRDQLGSRYELLKEMRGVANTQETSDTIQTYIAEIEKYFSWNE